MCYFVVPDHSSTNNSSTLGFFDKPSNWQLDSSTKHDIESDNLYITTWYTLVNIQILIHVRTQNISNPLFSTRCICRPYIKGCLIVKEIDNRINSFLSNKIFFLKVTDCVEAISLSISVWDSKEGLQNSEYEDETLQQYREDSEHCAMIYKYYYFFYLNYVHDFRK